MKPKKKGPSINKIISMLMDGQTYRSIAEALNIPLTTLHDLTSRPEHTARVREALEISADSYADKAEQVLIDAKSNLTEIQRAKELAQHYRWKAAKRRPRSYADKLDVTSGDEPLKNFAPQIIIKPTE